MLFFFPVCCNLAGIICDSLLYAVVKVAVSASSFRHVKELGPVIDVRPGARRTLDLSKLLHYLPKELTVKKGEIPLRYTLRLHLLGWNEMGENRMKFVL